MRQYLAHGTFQLQKVAGLIGQLNPARKWRIEIKQHQERRTLSQNKLIWCIYTEIANETGHTTDEIHEYCKEKFLPKRIVSINGVDHEIIGSTALLDKPAFSEYVERVAAWAATDFGITV
jgi:hypothetical protein